MAKELSFYVLKKNIRNMKSILSKFKPSCYKNYPFPHFIIKNALDENDYEILEKEYLLIEKYFKNQNNFSKNNIRMQFNNDDLKEMNLEIPSWKEFMNYHCSKSFLEELINIFNEDIKQIYPDLMEDLKSNMEKCTIKCQPGINTPVSKKTSVRLPHLDKTNTIFSGLFYMKDKKDNTDGGDLLLYKTKKKKKFYSKAELSNIDSVEIFDHIKYDKNIFICFLNTENSIHSVTPRNKTSHVRRLVNFVSKTHDGRSLYHLNRDRNYLRVAKNKIRDYFFVGR